MACCLVLPLAASPLWFENQSYPVFGVAATIKTPPIRRRPLSLDPNLGFPSGVEAVFDGSHFRDRVGH
jgi:hypothetical protein